MDNTQKQKILLAVIIALIVVIAYYSLFLRPAFARLLTVSKEVSTLKKEIVYRKNLINNSPSLSKQFASLKEKAAFIENSLPSEKEVPALLEELSRIAEESNVKILKIKPQEVLKTPAQNAQAKKPYTEYPILIEAKSGFHELGKFLEKLENLNRFVKIRRLYISGDKQDAKHHNAKLEVSTYVLQ